LTAARGIDDVAVHVVARKNAAHVADVVRQARHDQVGVVVRRHVRVQRPPAHDVMTGEGHQHGVFDVVVERVAVADAFQRDASH
jgi:hypothetical protein